MFDKVYHFKSTQRLLTDKFELDKLEKTGYSYIEYQQSDECVDEAIEANDYDFTDDGNIYVT